MNDWIEHFQSNYEDVGVCDLTKPKELKAFLEGCWYWNNSLHDIQPIGVINYDLIWRRTELTKLKDFTLMLDESSLITNPTSKRTKFILKQLQPSNIILLSGTPVSGAYEKLWSQMHLLGWQISKDLFYKNYVITSNLNGYPEILGYKNVDRLKRKMRENGCVFMKTEEVLDLPEQRFINIPIKESKEYKYFMKHKTVSIGDNEFIGDTTLTAMLYARVLCGAYNKDKLNALQDLIESTEDRLVIFYNFKNELETIKTIIPEDRPLSYVNGSIKDLSSYEEHSNSITLVQYQAGSMGINLQKANKIIYFSPTLSSEQYEQSKKRIHRIGQKNNCLYYKLVSGIENKIYNNLDMRRDYTDKLFEEDMGDEVL